MRRQIGDRSVIPSLVTSKPHQSGGTKVLTQLGLEDRPRLVNVLPTSLTCPLLELGEPALIDIALDN